MKRIVATTLVTLSMTGCATIFEGGTQPVTIKSVPEAAMISVTNRAGEKIHSGSTPATVTLKRGAGYFKSEIYTIKIEKEGFKPQELTVNGSANGWYVANILFGGLIGLLIVDPATGAMYKLTPETVEATLESMDVKSSKNEQSLTVVLSENVPAEVMARAVPLQAR